MNVTTLQKPSAVAPVAPPRISLANVKKGRQDVPIKVLGYGPEGVGKSTFASGAPNPFFICLDDRTSHLDISRADPKPRVWDDVLQWLTVLEHEKHDYKTVVVDPLTWLEPLCHLKVTGDPAISIDKFDGGFGRGINASLDQWRVLVAGLERLWTKGMHVVLLSHSTVKSFKDPSGPEYDRYELGINAKAAGLFKQWADFVLFMKHEAVAKTVDGKRARGQATGRCVAYTKWTAAYDAKFSGSGPDELPLGWGSFYEAVQRSRTMGDELRERIESLLAEINHEGTTAKARELVRTAGDNHGRLEEIANALVTKLDEGKGATK